MKGSEENENTTPVLTDGTPKALQREASIGYETRRQDRRSWKVERAGDETARAGGGEGVVEEGGVNMER